MAILHMSETNNPTAQAGSIGIRLLCLGGALVTAALICLGGIWPSYYTIVALVALPSPILFLVAVVRPSLVHNHRSLRSYLIGCCIASALSWLDEIWWLHRAGSF
jgi:hypothetical protein